MMRVENVAYYQRHRAALEATSLRAMLLPMLLFGSMGGITWAIRGTSGWAPIDGTLVPGLTWGLFWFYLCYRKGIDARGVVLWLGLGIALGGQLGYGRYVSWIQGNFAVGDEVLPVSPWAGVVWFFICGIAWGAPGGILLGWALDGAASARRWALRVVLVLMLLVLLFNLGGQILGEGIITWLGGIIRHWCPWLLFPHAATGIYAGELDGHLGSTVYLNTQNFAVLLWWAAAMLIAALKRERATLVAGGVIGGGFGFGFLLSALWVLGYTYAPGYTDWWKVWEVHAGFNLGVLYVIVLYWAIRQVDKAHTERSVPLAPNRQPTEVEERRTTLFWAVCGFSLVFAAGVQYYAWTFVPVAMAYPMALLIFLKLPHSEHGMAERRAGITLAYSVFLLLYVLVHGASKTAGAVLELYPLEAAGGYRWPAGRVALFLPAVAILLIGSLVATWRMLRGKRPPGLPELETSRLPVRMVDLCTFTGVVGAVTIWPEGLFKLGPLYAILVLLAVFAMNRINMNT